MASTYTSPSRPWLPVKGVTELSCPPDTAGIWPAGGLACCPTVAMLSSSLSSLELEFKSSSSSSISCGASSSSSSSSISCGASSSSSSSSISCGASSSSSFSLELGLKSSSSISCGTW